MSLELITDELMARQPPEARAIIRILLAKIAELEARLNQTPRNSSLPPSPRHPHARPVKAKPQSKRKHGGQPGHAKTERPWIPSEQSDGVVTLKPTACRRRGMKLAGDDVDPWRHQVEELPTIRPLVTECQQHRLRCPDCGDTTCAPLPAGVPRGQSGPKLIAFVAL